MAYTRNKNPVFAGLRAKKHGKCQHVGETMRVINKDKAVLPCPVRNKVDYSVFQNMYTCWNIYAFMSRLWKNGKLSFESKPISAA